jgi:general secretion pathway protein F
MSKCIYRFRAVNEQGEIQKGRLASVSRSAAVESLHRRGWIPLDVGTEVRGHRLLKWYKWDRTSTSRVQLGDGEVLALTRSLAVLLGAGLTIDRALQIAAESCADPRLSRFNRALLQAIRGGQTLSGAFAMSGQRLPSFYRSMLEAGEAGGALGQTLARVVELLERQQSVRERVRSALIYPALLGGVVLLTLVMLLTLVLPRFQTLFAESEQVLPLSTRIVLAIGEFASSRWWLIVALLGALSGALYTWLKSKDGRLRFDHWAIRSRMTLGLPAAVNVGRFLRTVGTLSRTGSTLPVALRIARGTLSNRALYGASGTVLSDVQAGLSLSEALARVKVFPSVAVQLARVGEETGQLESLLLSSAQVLEEESQLKLERLLTLLVPALTIGMGLVVAALIGSVLIGLLSINDLAF